MFLMIIPDYMKNNLTMTKPIISHLFTLTKYIFIPYITTVNRLKCLYDCRTIFRYVSAKFFFDIL